MGEENLPGGQVRMSGVYAQEAGGGGGVETCCGPTPVSLRHRTRAGPRRSRAGKSPAQRKPSTAAEHFSIHSCVPAGAPGLHAPRQVPPDGGLVADHGLPWAFSWASCPSASPSSVTLSWASGQPKTLMQRPAWRCSAPTKPWRGAWRPGTPASSARDAAAHAAHREPVGHCLSLPLERPVMARYIINNILQLADHKVNLQMVNAELGFWWRWNLWGINEMCVCLCVYVW